MPGQSDPVLAADMTAPGPGPQPFKARRLRKKGLGHKVYFLRWRIWGNDSGFRLNL